MYVWIVGEMGGGVRSGRVNHDLFPLFSGPVGRIIRTRGGVHRRTRLILYGGGDLSPVIYFLRSSITRNIEITVRNYTSH